jgi:hypothetical protein
MQDHLKGFRRLRHPRLLVGLAVTAVLVLAVGIAGAAIPDSSDGEIHGCYKKNQGQLRVIDAEAGATCLPSELALAWSQTGPTGATGATGPTGPRGPSNGFSRFHDGELPADTLAAPRLLELSVPAGRYVTTGTAIVRNTGAVPAGITCQTMHPSGDFDLARATLAPAGQPGDTQTLAMNPVGLAPGGASPTIFLDCDDAGGSVVVSWMKISTVQVETLTNTFSP